MEIHPPKEYNPRIRAIIGKHEDLWSGEKENIYDITHRIYLISGARPFKSAPYCAGPKASELEELEIKFQLTTRVIEHSNAEWATSVLFAPKKMDAYLSTSTTAN